MPVSANGRYTDRLAGKGANGAGIQLDIFFHEPEDLMEVRGEGDINFQP